MVMRRGRTLRQRRSFSNQRPAENGVLSGEALRITNDIMTTHRQFILSLEGVNKTFYGFKAIDELNFYMDEGELRVVIGPNGAGKSTMLDIITGRTRPDKGKVEFGQNTDLTKLNEYQINR